MESVNVPLEYYSGMFDPHITNHRFDYEEDESLERSNFDYRKLQEELEETQLQMERIEKLPSDLRSLNTSFNGKQSELQVLSPLDTLRIQQAVETRLASLLSRSLQYKAKQKPENSKKESRPNNAQSSATANKKAGMKVGGTLSNHQVKTRSGSAIQASQTKFSMKNNLTNSKVQKNLVSKSYPVQNKNSSKTSRVEEFKVLDERNNLDLSQIEDFDLKNLPASFKVAFWRTVNKKQSQSGHPVHSENFMKQRSDSALDPRVVAEVLKRRKIFPPAQFGTVAPVKQAPNPLGPRRSTVRPPELYFKSTPHSAPEGEPRPQKPPQPKNPPEPPTPQKSEKGEDEEMSEEVIDIPKKQRNKVIQTLPERRDKSIQARTLSPMREFIDPELPVDTTATQTLPERLETNTQTSPTKSSKLSRTKQLPNQKQHEQVSEDTGYNDNDQDPPSDDRALKRFIENQEKMLESQLEKMLQQRKEADKKEESINQDIYGLLRTRQTMQRMQTNSQGVVSNADEAYHAVLESQSKVAEQQILRYLSDNLLAQFIRSHKYEEEHVENNQVALTMVKEVLLGEIKSALNEFSTKNVKETKKEEDSDNGLDELTDNEPLKPVSTRATSTKQLKSRKKLSESDTIVLSDVQSSVHIPPVSRDFLMRNQEMQTVDEFKSSIAVQVNPPPINIGIQVSNPAEMGVQTSMEFISNPLLPGPKIAMVEPKKIVEEPGNTDDEFEDLLETPKTTPEKKSVEQSTTAPTMPTTADVSIQMSPLQEDKQEEHKKDEFESPKAPKAPKEYTVEEIMSSFKTNKIKLSASSSSVDSWSSSSEISDGEARQIGEYGFFSEGEVMMLPSFKDTMKYPLRMDKLTPKNFKKMVDPRSEGETTSDHTGINDTDTDKESKIENLTEDEGHPLFSDGEVPFPITNISMPSSTVYQVDNQLSEGETISMLTPKKKVAAAEQRLNDALDRFRRIQIPTHKKHADASVIEPGEIL